MCHISYNHYLFFLLFNFSNDGRPKGSSSKQFLLLPKTNEHCLKVDIVKGLWYFCATCNKEVASRKGRPFTLARWIDHQESPEHKDHVRRQCEVVCLELKEKANKGKLTSLEKQTLGQLTKKQSPLQQFFLAAKSKKGENKAKKMLPTSDTAGSVINVDTGKDTVDGVEVVEEITFPKRGACEGVLPDFRGALKDSLRAYCLYASIDVKTQYKVGIVSVGGRHEKHAQIFAKNCVGAKVTYRKHANGRIFSCDNCESLR